VTAQVNAGATTAPPSTTCGAHELRKAHGRVTQAAADVEHAVALARGVSSFMSMVPILGMSVGVLLPASVLAM
jgi:hypothetical protein